MFLRITNTPYLVKFTTTPSRKGKLPYITYNGVQIPDSYFAQNWLVAEGVVDHLPDDVLDETELGAVEAYRCMLVNLADLVCVGNWRLFLFLLFTNVLKPECMFCPTRIVYIMM